MRRCTRFPTCSIPRTPGCSLVAFVRLGIVFSISILVRFRTDIHTRVGTIRSEKHMLIDAMSTRESPIEHFKSRRNILT